jgi:hypothetical protein
MNTDSFKVEFKSNCLEAKINVFCSYCGKEIKDTGRYYDRDYYENYECDCEGAKKEIELTKEADSLINKGENIKNYEIPYHIDKLSKNEIRKIRLEQEIKFRQEELNEIKL